WSKVVSVLIGEYKGNRDCRRIHIRKCKASSDDRAKALRDGSFDERAAGHDRQRCGNCGFINECREWPKSEKFVSPRSCGPTARLNAPVSDDPCCSGAAHSENGRAAPVRKRV